MKDKIVVGITESKKAEIPHVRDCLSNLRSAGAEDLIFEESVKFGRDRSPFYGPIRRYLLGVLVPNL